MKIQTLVWILVKFGGIMNQESAEVSGVALNVVTKLENELLYSSPHQDIIQQLNSNLVQLEDICNKLNFVMREITTVMKISVN